MSLEERSLISLNVSHYDDLEQKKEESLTWQYKMLPHLRAFQLTWP